MRRNGLATVPLPRGLALFVVVSIMTNISYGHVNPTITTRSSTISSTRHRLTPLHHRCLNEEVTQKQSSGT